MLFSMFRTRDVTVITTNTTFSLADPHQDDVDLIVRRARPLLHVLVQATDFFFKVERTTLEGGKELPPIERIEIVVRTARGQPEPAGKRFWDREHSIIYGDESEPYFPYFRTTIR
jgi:hypothetical protein